MTPNFARHFATGWLKAWNAHDLEQILSHYTEDFIMTSPVVIKLGLSLNGSLQGKAAVGAYWRKALKLVPDLRFELIRVLCGVNTVTLIYKGVRERTVAEVFHFTDQGQVDWAMAHDDTPEH
ncbi:MAG: nuclear transport factor 2 family protein [Alphaproteobacteria bacterium]|nr:nuclear transport factor 2 family protein [Alphaproteobacteria bacterium]